jgi:cell division transport system permease protein
MNASPTARQSGHIPNLLPRRGLSGSILVIIIGIMVFLAALALAGGLALGSAIGQWRDALAHDLTVQIPAGPDADAAVKRALDTLLATPGVASARALARPELEALLEPWLGRGNVPADLPLPRLVDVRLLQGATLDAAALQARLDGRAEGATVDDPASWLSGVVGLAARARLLAGLAVGLVLGALTAIVVFATRSGLEANRDLVEVLHQVGARDGYIAGVFQRHFLLLGLKGSGLGLGLALVALVLVTGLHGLDGVLGHGAGGDTFADGLSLSPAQWAMIAGLAPLVAGMTTFTARLTVRRTLAGLV